MYVVQEILGDHDPVALRQFFMGSHYRSPMDFSRGGLEEAGKAMERIFETLDRMQRSLRLKVDTVADAALMASFCQEMDDDFNMPRALAPIFDEVRALNRLLGEKKQKGIENRAAGLRVMCETLGFNKRDIGIARRSVGEESRPSRVGRSKPHRSA
jgi:cysteinyl-tRNA synthetase